VVAAIGSGLLACLTARAAALISWEAPAPTPESPIAPRMPYAAWRRTIREADSFTMPPRSCGAYFTHTRDINRCRASTSPDRS
jgi:hypothetical protein